MMETKIFETLKVGKTYHLGDRIMPFRLRTVLGINDGLVWYKKEDGSCDSAHYATLGDWIEVKQKVKKKFFFFIYKSNPQDIYIYGDNEMFYANPVTIEREHKKMKNVSSVLWVGDIIEVEIDDPRPGN